jgi:ABC transport system ATP-binding/permease protein
MALVTVLDAHLAFGDRPLLDGAAFAVQTNERIGLIGRNGTGKSTLLRVISGRVQLDDGVLQVRDGLRIGFVEQEPELEPAQTLGESLAAGIPGERWTFQARLNEYMDRLGLEPDRPLDTASGGERKRAALARALALDPELLLLDEPTNHLDIAGIERLEELLAKVRACIVVTHDRTFLDRVVTRIVELDRGVLRSYPGNFAAYEARKSDELAAEEVANRRFDKFWAQEEVWIRKGVEARRTRNEGRVKRLEQLRLERAERRARLGNVNLTMDAGQSSGRLVADIVDVSKRFGERPIVDRLSLRIMRGDRIGLIGPNGAGKSTLIRIILGELAPDSGSVRLGSNVQVAYFDQLREQLDPERTVADTISPGSDWVELGTQRKHVMTYLADFLFSAQRAKAPIKMLSGGERNRLLLARLFARPANLVVLDEPTNDLDIESLELLEEKLQGYGGTLLLVSHDRRFLDNVVTQTLAAEGGGVWRQYVGGYADWLRRRPAPASTPDERPRTAAPAPRTKPKTKLSNKEERELSALPQEIQALEQEQHDLTARLSSAEHHRRGAELVRLDIQRARDIEQLLEAKFARWEELEQLRAATSAAPRS